MQKKSTSHCAFFNPHVLIALLFCAAAACSILTVPSLGFSQPEAPSNLPDRTLTIAERVAYQRAIEDVYWRHRIWPKERPDPKPSLDAVMPEAQIEKKVTDYLRKSQALADYWQRPLTAEQLQGEMDRMATHTKQPEVLRELFEALGNDPFIIAECLARPALAEHLLENSYAYDERIHGDLRQRAEAELHAHLHELSSGSNARTVNGTYSETELIKSDSAQDEPNVGPDHAVKLNSREWDQTVQKLAATLSNTRGATDVPVTLKRSEGGSIAKTAPLTQINTGALSSLQEDEGSYYAAAVLSKADNRLKVATVSWPKEPLESWLTKAEHEVAAATAAPSSNYLLPNVSDEGECVDDTWTATATPPDGRVGHTAVWTGNEMIVWGGFRDTFPNRLFNTGGRYHPSTDSWISTNTTNAPSARHDHTAVWTGSEMIVWGGSDSNGNLFNTGGRYDPETDRWVSTSTSNAPTARLWHTAVWTGTQMIVWGGLTRSDYPDIGGRYNPATNSWTATSVANAPQGRVLHTAVWTGSVMVVWGGSAGHGFINTGGRYSPATNSWTTISTTNAPTGRYYHTAVWTGTAMIIWGGDAGGNTVKTGGKYFPSTDSWAATSTTNAPSARSYHTAIWTGHEMIVWGGLGGASYLNRGGRYNPNADSWTATSTAGAPTGRSAHTAVWSGNEMIVWGGLAGSDYPDIGGRYNPTRDSWMPTGKTPSRRAYHAAVWTGSEMIIWGGIASATSDFFTNSGAKYDPSTDSWTPTSTSNAPTGRELPTAVWTGSEMIIWGGYSYNGNDNYWNTGGRYNPGTDSWRATSTANAPAGRESHSAVWTGTAMIVWGGSDGTNDLDTGAIYNPGTNSWTATSTANAPSARNSHAAVWTGSEMIIWGGAADTSGGRYNPSADTWMATSTTNAPTARGIPTGVWTGNEMIVWGGFFFDGTFQYLNTGGRYNPNLNSWTATSTANAPDGRTGHTAVWAGNEMIIWGGEGGSNLAYYFNTGGRYHPGTDSWTPTSTVNAPEGRFQHTAVWTGSQMIVWGGKLYSNTSTDTGGRYCANVSQLGNISTRAFVQTGDNVMIGGFIVQGSGPKRVIIRAIGPELGAPPYNIPNAMANPTLELHNSTGALIASNDNWQTTIIGGIITSDERSDIRNSGYAPGDGRESAIIAELPPGNYTAIVRGVDNTTGVALVEVYDLTTDAASILGNISTRSFVQTGDNVMIGGFIVQGGSQLKRVIVRAIGPELGVPPYNVPNALANPTLELHNSTGALIASNDNWQTTIIGGTITSNQLRDIMNSGYAPGDGRESAIIADLSPGNYTAIVRGVDNMTGVALVEVYDLH